MKKILSFILFAALVLALGVNSFAAGNAEISFKTSEPDEKGHVFVDVVISGGGEPAMLQFCVAYDSDKLDFVSVSAGDAFSGNSAPLINATEGKIYFVWDSLKPLKNSGTLLRIEFSPKAGSGTASVWIDSSEDTVIADKKMEDIGVIGEKAEIGGSENPESESSGSSEKSESSVSAESSENSKSSESSESSDSSDSSEQDGAQNAPEAETGHMNGIEIEKTQLTINLGEETTVGISGTDEKVIWYSSNEGVILVEDGKIIPVAPGTATVTVMTEDGLGEATCVVTVIGEEGAEASSETESVENVIKVDSPRGEKEDTVPAWAWVLIAVLGAGVICVFVVLGKKAGIGNKK